VSGEHAPYPQARAYPQARGGERHARRDSSPGGYGQDPDTGSYPYGQGPSTGSHPYDQDPDTGPYHYGRTPDTGSHRYGQGPSTGSYRHGQSPITGSHRRQVLDEEADPRARHATRTGDDFGYVISWSILGTVVPGLGLIKAGRRLAGALALTVAVGGALALGGALFLMGHPLRRVVSRVDSPDRLLALAAGALGVGVLWILVIVATEIALRSEHTLTWRQRLVANCLLIVLVGAIAVPAGGLARYALLQRQHILGIATAPSPPPPVNQVVPTPTPELVVLPPPG